MCLPTLGWRPCGTGILSIPRPFCFPINGCQRTPCASPPRCWVFPRIWLNLPSRASPRPAPGALSSTPAPFPMRPTSGLSGISTPTIRAWSTRAGGCSWRRGPRPSRGTGTWKRPSCWKAANGPSLRSAESLACPPTCAWIWSTVHFPTSSSKAWNSSGTASIPFPLGWNRRSTKTC